MAVSFSFDSFAIKRTKAVVTPDLGHFSKYKLFMNMGTGGLGAGGCF